MSYKSMKGTFDFDINELRLIIIWLKNRGRLSCTVCKGLLYRWYVFIGYLGKYVQGGKLLEASFFKCVLDDFYLFFKSILT
jgi:hypothetical protein